jgi:hypothetical protein
MVCSHEKDTTGHTSQRWPERAFSPRALLMLLAGSIATNSNTTLSFTTMCCLQQHLMAQDSAILG